MLLTIMLLTLLGAGVGVLLVKVRSSAATTGAMSQTRRAFYVCDGLARTVTKIAHDYIANSASTVTTADITQRICTVGGSTYSAGACGTPLLPTLMPPGYKATHFSVSVSASSTSTLPSGPFAGMNAQQTSLTLNVSAESTGSGVRCSQQQDIALAQVGAFQFFVFSEGDTDIYNSPSMTIGGRVHVNGDFCGTGDSLKIDTMTASGRIIAAGSGHSGHSGCPNAQWFTDRDLSFKDKNTGSYKDMTPTSDSGCTNCSNGGASSSLSWKDWALATWNGSVQDSAHGVTPLKLPVSAASPVQFGEDGDGNPITNVGTQRLLIDPPQANDTSDLKSQRLAYKADIRIIDGVWYRRDPANPESWPGIPIWSDHPGSAPRSWHASSSSIAAPPGATAPTTNDAGQADIRVSRAWGACGAGACPTPRLFSYYEYDSYNKRVFDDTSGVISYGTLFRSATTPVRWTPGFFMHHHAPISPATRDPDGMQQHRFCMFNSAGGENNPLDDFRLIDAVDTTGTAQQCYACTGPASATVNTSCTDTGETLVNLDVGAKILNATRMGFEDHRVRLDAGTARARILPVNFDVAALATALGTTTNKELGSYFDGTPGNPAFNGIVYITYTWPGQLKDASFKTSATALTGPPDPWPDPRLANDVTQVEHHTNHDVDGGHFTETQATTALPWPLCSAGPGAATNFGFSRTATGVVDQRVGFSRPSDDGIAANGFEPYFTVPNCDSTVSATSRPNAIRVINATNIDPVRFPRGLSIVTNLPAYLLGDVNTVTSPWKPVMVAADAVTLLSNDWTDANSRWTTGFSKSSRPATSATYKVAILAGDVATGSTNWGGGINNFPRFMENWSGTGAIVGSMVIAFRSVFQNHKLNVDAYGAPTWTWSYETQFDTTFNQPPGTPMYNVTAISKWTP